MSVHTLALIKYQYKYPLILLILACYKKCITSYNPCKKYQNMHPTQWFLPLKWVNKTSNIKYKVSKQKSSNPFYPGLL